MERLCLALLLVSNVAAGAHLRKPSSLSTSANTSDGETWPVSDNETCKLPATHGAHENMVLLAASEHHAVYVADDADELNFLGYDCQTGKQLLFAHIPKNAGTTIEDLGRRYGHGWGRFMRPHNTGAHCTFWHTPPAMIQGYNPYADPNVEVFCVTRDPWARAVSEYTYRYAMHPHEFSPYGQCTKAAFNMFLSSMFTQMRIGNRWINDCHMLPQWEYIEGPHGRRWCQHILPLDGLTEKFNALMAAKGVPVRLSPYDKSNEATTCPSFRDKADRDLSSVYTERTKADMRSIYAVDFAHIGDALAREGK